MKRILVLVAVGALIVGPIVLRSLHREPARVSVRRPLNVSPELAASKRTSAGPVEITVFGAVRSPGKITLSRPSLAEALDRAVTYILSDTAKVRVLQYQAGVRVKDIVIDASGILRGTTPDVALENGDHVFVPEKIL